jgi:hypothetical protein
MEYKVRLLSPPLHYLKMSKLSSTEIPITVEIPSPPSISSSEEEPKLNPIDARYAPSEEASQLPPGAGGEGNDAIANDPSVFDDPQLRKFYWPRANYENIHRFFPDFKWTVGEEKRYYSGR